MSRRDHVVWRRPSYPGGPWRGDGRIMYASAEVVALTLDRTHDGGVPLWTYRRDGAIRLTAHDAAAMLLSMDRGDDSMWWTYGSEQVDDG